MSVYPCRPQDQRRHQIETDFAIETIEGGFAVPRPVEALEYHEVNPVERFVPACGMGFAEVRNGDLYSAIHDVTDSAQRQGSLIQPWANTYLLLPATVVPVLQDRLQPGSHILECEVVADPISPQYNWAMT